MLPPRHIGHKIFDVQELLITNCALIIEALIHSFTEAENILGFLLRFGTQKNLTLHRQWDLCIRKAQPSFRHIHKAHQPIDRFTRGLTRP